MSPLGTYNTFKDGMDDLEGDELLEMKLQAGRGVYGQMKITDDDNNELPWDGVAFGSLKVRGAWILSDYFKAEPGATLEEDGWFETGDVATIDPNGFMAIWIERKTLLNLAASGSAPLILKTQLPIIPK